MLSKKRNNYSSICTLVLMDIPCDQKMMTTLAWTQTNETPSGPITGNNHGRMMGFGWGRVRWVFQLIVRAIAWTQAKSWFDGVCRSSGTKDYTRRSFKSAVASMVVCVCGLIRQWVILSSLHQFLGLATLRSPVITLIVVAPAHIKKKKKLD